MQSTIYSTLFVTAVPSSTSGSGDESGATGVPASGVLASPSGGSGEGESGARSSGAPGSGTLGSGVPGNGVPGSGATGSCVPQVTVTVTAAEQTVTVVSVTNLPPSYAQRPNIS